VQAVADTPDRLDGTPAEGDVDLAAEVAGVDLDDVGIAFEVVVPDVLEDLVLRNRLARPAQEVLQQRELPGRQGDVGAAAPARTGGGVQGEIPGGQHRGAGPHAPPEQRPQAGDQHHER